MSTNRPAGAPSRPAARHARHAPPRGRTPGRTWLIGALLTGAWLIPVSLGALPASGAGPAEAPAADGDRSPPTAAPDAASPDGTVADPPFDRAEVAARLAALEADAALSDEERSRQAASYQRVLENLDAAAADLAEAATLRESLSAAPALTEAIRARLAVAEPLPDPPLTLPSAADLPAVEALLAEEAAAIDAMADRLAALEQGLADEADALPGWRRELADGRTLVQDVDDALQGARTTPGGAAAQPRHWVLASERQRLRAEIALLELRLAGNDARRALAEARRDEARLALDRAEARRAWLQAEFDQRRRAKAERVRAETEAAKAATLDADPLVQALARGNAQLAETIEQVDRQVAAAEAERAATLATTATLRHDFANDRQRIAAAGLSRALGRVLIDQRERLPDPRELRRQAAARADATAEATLALLHYREALQDLRGGAAVVFADDLAALPPAAAERLRADLDAQLTRRLELLGGAGDAQERRLRALSELDLAALDLAALSREYRAFLAERLLWLRSHEPVTAQGFEALPAVLTQWLDPATWLAVLRALGAELTGGWAWWIGLLAATLLLAVDRLLRRRLRATATPLRRVATDRFGYTLWAILLTLLLAAPLSLVLALIGLALSAAPEAAGAAADGFPQAVGHGLLRLVPGLYALRVFRLLCLAGGVADRHFRWPGETLRRLRRLLDLAMLTLLPLGFVAATASAQGELASATLGRLALTAVSLGLAAALAIVLHPRRGALAQPLAAVTGGLANRLRWLWYPLAVGVPLALAGLTLAGFQYTAVTLFHLWIGQLWLLLVLVVVQQSVVRWLLVTRRALVLRTALERRARRAAQQQAQAGDPGTGTAAGAPAGPRPTPTVGPRPGADPDDAAVDLVALDSQTRRMVSALLTVAALVGLWVLWSDVLPALNVFERIPLWQTTAEVDGVTRNVPVTVADLGLMLIIVVVAVIAVRNLPALIEILLLKYSGVSASGRYTIGMVTGYAITAVALFQVTGRIGLQWQQLQWLVAALGVGIGFGLQEIVANFICGIIILFERPVRIGDMVTIGEQTGTVSRIEIRATTIRTLDQRELLVPNKQLITAEVINWTLSDTINRDDILISIEYGSDTAAALRILNEVAAAEPRVIADPAPVIAVTDFGERGVDLLLRYFLDSVAERVPVRGALLHAAHQRLRAAGIAIGRPQREVRLRDTAAEPDPAPDPNPAPPRAAR